jgi:hypothetical protein
MRSRRLLLVVWLLTWFPPATASAEWLLTPFVGLNFAGETSFIIEAGGLETKLALGGSLAQLGPGWLGFEADFGYTPRFFERETERPTLASSGLFTLTGSVIVAIPQSVVRESLRPYIVGGVGWMRAGIDYVQPGFDPFDANLLGLNLGGGALGALTERTALRFELRYFRNLTEAEAEAAQIGATRLSFWRASVGVTLRY